MTVQFYKPTDKYGELSNFFIPPQPIMFLGMPYASSEHLYHALKFLGPDATTASRQYAETIRLTKTPNMAKVLARMHIGGSYAWRTALNPIIQDALANGVAPRPDWDAVKLEKMRMILMLKFQQSGVCRAVLLSTGTATIAEHTAADLYWADGGDSGEVGQNHLGLLLMEVREILRLRIPQNQSVIATPAVAKRQHARASGTLESYFMKKRPRATTTRFVATPSTEASNET